ncbi:MAG: YraN family protein [Solirubrobacteraceae bacterium]|jgi:putative endonuclease
MTANARQALGRAGEQLALEHYKRLGFEVLERNHRTRTGELDLIVADQQTIVFVEVKTGRAGALDPLVSITARKLERVRRLAREWLTTRPASWRRAEVRFDVVAIVLDADDRLVALEQFADVV